MVRPISGTVCVSALILSVGFGVVSATGEEGVFELVETKGSFISGLMDLDREAWNYSNYASRDTHYDSAFSPDYVDVHEDGLSFRIDRRVTSHLDTTAAEIQSRQRYGYGRYEVIMKPAKGSGLVSSFFTYTGGWYGNPHDEIDIEFLGTDTTKVSLNVFTKGRAIGRAKKVDLPFDAAEEFHLYAFEWTPGAVHWYVDDERIYSALATERSIPSTPSRIMLNLWTGREQFYDWHGEPTFKDGVTADYLCISFQEFGDKSEQCSDRHADLVRENAAR